MGNKKQKFCMDCGKELSLNPKAKRCKHCAKKYFNPGAFNKGHKQFCEKAALGARWKHGEDAKKKIGKANSNPNQIVKHHLFYSKTNPDAGVIFITKKLHDRIHSMQQIFEKNTNPWFTLEGVNKRWAK